MNTDPRLPIPPLDAYQQSLSMRLNSVLRDLMGGLGMLKGGYISARSNQDTAAPTTGTWSQGDEVRNSAPTEQGTAGSKYVVLGWVCVAGGTPGTWVQMRTLTGN